MVNQDKIIEALRYCATPNNPCPANCPYYREGDGDIMGCTQRLTADTVALVDTLVSDIKVLRKIKDLLLKDIEDRDALLEKKVEEVYPEFMQDYKAMREELESITEELEETQRELRKLQRGY